MTHQQLSARSTRARSRFLVTGAIAGSVILVAACGGHHRVATPPSTSSTVAPTTTTKPKPKPKPTSKTSPLTGLPAANAAQLRAPAVVVKIDNVDAARPQSGVNQADVVYEELVEGGLTRLAAVFQSQYPTLVGPVRSGRLTDEGVADDLNYPVFAYSGTNGVFLPILRSQPLTDVDDENRPSFFWRTNFAASPHNLYTNVAALATASTAHKAPAPLFAFRAARTLFSGAGLGLASQIRVGFPAATIGWDYDTAAGLWLRFQNGSTDRDRAGQQLSASNVIIQFIPYVTSLMSSGEGGPPAPIPAGNMVGRGVAWYFSAGRIIKGTWSRPRLTALTSYVDASGATVHLAPGRTWVELVPIGTVPTVVP